MTEIHYAQAVGNLIYPMISTRQNLSYSASLFSRYMSKPGKDTGKLLNGFLIRYLKGTQEAKLVLF